MNEKDLTKTLNEEKHKGLIENGKKIVEKVSESVPPKSSGDRPSQTGLENAATEVKAASLNLVEAVNELKLPMLLTVGMLEKVLLWLKVTTVIGTATLLVMLYAAVKITLAANVSAETNATQTALAQKLEEKLKVSPGEVLEKIEKKQAEQDAEEEIAAAESPKIEADEDGKVAIVVPQKLSPEKKQEIRERVVEAKRKGEVPSVRTRAVRIEVDLERKQVTDINQQETGPAEPEKKKDTSMSPKQEAPKKK